MARRPPQARPPKPSQETPAPALEEVVNPRGIPGRTLALIVAAILLCHYAVAAWSLLRENPTVDEVNHLPAGITYWQTGSFRVYHHNPPLIKLVAALPVAGAKMQPPYNAPAWRTEWPSPSAFGQGFLYTNAANYFELFSVSRLMMPLFSVLGGLVVFSWSKRLWGDWGGLLSLVLWCACPNILAHSRLITSDAAAASIGIAATYAFVLYLNEPTWRRAAIAGLLLGFAQLTKFSLLLLIGLWPLLWLIQTAFEIDQSRFVEKFRRATLHAIAILALCVLVIDVGYGFEGVGRRLGTFDFASRSFLTREVVGPDVPKRSPNQLLDVSWAHRINRFRGTWMANLPSPLPSHYLIGFDEQKIEADALPLWWFDPRITDKSAVTGYPVYLDGELRRTGWRDYYVRSLLYKVPEGTILLVTISLVVFAFSRRARASLVHESALFLAPAAFLGAMTFLTDINLGLRYVLPIFPFVFVWVGRLGVWIEGLSGTQRRLAVAAIIGPLGCTLIASAMIAPSFLAYFNYASGGPDRTPPRLIDSNLDWGQDLVGLQRWIKENGETKPIGIAYFGQISPSIFQLRAELQPELKSEAFDWFLPAAKPGKIKLPEGMDRTKLIGPAKAIQPGVYAISASLVQGLPWRVYDSSQQVWAGFWRAEEDAFGYFRELTPFARVGHSILLFRITDEQAATLNAGFASAGKIRRP